MTRVPTAAAMCISPESLLMHWSEAASKSTTSTNSVWPHRLCASLPRLISTPAFASLADPSTQTSKPSRPSLAASSVKYSMGQHFAGPNSAPGIMVITGFSERSPNLSMIRPWFSDDTDKTGFGMSARVSPRSRPSGPKFRRIRFRSRSASSALQPFIRARLSVRSGSRIRIQRPPNTSVR